MAQLQCMDAHLDTLSIKLYQVNVHLDRIARRQATIGGDIPEAYPSPPPPVASEFEDDMMMVLTMTLQMMMMEMLALPMRCLLDILTLCHS